METLFSIGLYQDEGLYISWLPEGLLLENSKQKLESLRIQHESQMETLQSELVAEREFNSQNALQLEEQHQQMVARLRDELEAEKATMLDTVLMQIGELTKKKIQLAKNENKEEIALQVQAMRVTMEQVHTGQLTVLRGELEEARRSQHGHDESHTKEHQQSSTDSLSVKTNHGAMPDFGPLDESLTRKYEQLVNKINEQLECQVLPELEEGGESDETPRATEAIRSLLEGQREEISQLRSQMLSEYETLLRSRTENVSEQSKQVTQLQQEIESLQAQYEGQIKTFEEQLQSMSESDEAKVKTQEVQARELEELRSYYEKHVQNIEKTFSEEIAGLRSNYEAQISQLTSSKESESPSDSKESIEFTREREYVKRTTMLTVISDSDESSAAESSRIGMPSSGIGTLEKQIQEQDAKISELEKLLDDEKIKFVSSEKEIKSLKNQVNELEKRVKDLSDAIEEKDHMIGNLRAENDLLTKEIEKSKVEFVEKANEFEKEREKFVKDLEEKEKVISDLEGEREKYLVELQEKEIKSDDSSSVDYSQDKYDLLTRIEDMEHRHKEELESVRNELEHDSKVEIETMQSEFKVQLEIELKRQAADLQKIHEENVKNLAFGQDVHDHSEIQEEATPDTMELQTSSDEVSISNGAVNISDGVDGVPVDVLREEYEQKVATLKMELEQLRMEREELSRKHQLDMDNLQTQLTEIQEKYENLMTDKDVDEDSNVEELLKEKYDQQLELSKQLMQQEFTETLESERSRFVERHRKMMDNFMADRTQEAEELKVKHEKELEDLRGQLTAEHQQQVEELGQKHEKYLESLRQDLTSQHNEELFEVKLQHHKELETVASRSSEQGVEDESKQKSEDAQDEVDAVPDYMQGQEVELHKLTVEWEQKIRELKISHADELSAAALDTETVKSELEAAHQKELQDLEGRLKRAHEDEVERIQKELQDLEGRLKRTHEDEVERIQEELEEKEKLLSKTHRKEIEKLEAQHQEEIEKLKDEQKESSIPGRHQEAMREISEVFLPPQTTPLLSAADLDSTIESEISGADGDFLMKSTPRDPPVMSRGSTPDEMLETRTFAEVVRGIPPVPSAADLMEKEEKIQQLENEVKELKTKLDDVHSDEQLLTGRRTREAEEDSNLVHMLRSDLDRIGAERDAVQSANDRLLQFLSDSVKNYMSVEDAINRRLSRLVNQSGQRSRPPSGTPRDDRHGSEVDHRGRSSDYGARAASPRSDRGDPNTSQDSTALEETSILSSNTDEGLDVSQRLTESIFAGPELDPEGEEILTDARGRVQTSVNHLLEMIEKTTQQLLDAKQTQQELVDTLASRNSESETIQARCTEVEDRLREEVSAKEYLALELHKAEGLISGYSTERDSLESRLESLDEQRQALVLDLETTRSKLHEFQESQDELQSQQDLVTRQQQILTSNAGQETQALLQEVSTLTQERRELEKQTRHQLERSQSRTTELESLLEEEQQLHEQVVRIKKEEIEDLRLQLDNLERQLKASKQFLTEQSAEREQEHEEYQREVDRLQQLLQDREKKQSAEGRLQREVQDLSEQLEDRIASEGELDMQRQRLQQVLQDKEVTAAELKQWVQQLESELEEKITTEQKLRQTINRLEKQLSSRSVPEETSDSSLNSTAEQLQFKPAVMSPDRRSPIRRQITLEEELERTRKTGEELALEKETLQQQVQEQLLQISALKNQLDDMRQYGRDVSTVTHTSQLRERLAVERESLEMKEEEVTSLQEQKDKLKHMLAERESEVSGLRKELEEVENQTPSMSNTEQKVREENANLKAEVEKLLGHQEDTVDVGMPKLAQDLLDEKNREIDELTDRVQQLEMALEATSVIDDSIRENDEIDLLREELKQKTEQIAELQDKLATAQGGQFFGEMSLTDADRSLLETSFSEKTNFQQELEETIAQKTEEMSDLRKELETSQLALTEVEAEKVGIKTDLENHVHELEEQLETVEASNKDLKEQINQLQNKHDATLKNLQDAEKRLYDSTGDSEQNQNLQEELQTLQEDLNITRNKLAESECLKSELESAKMALKESEKRLEDLTTKSLKKSSEQEEESSADGKNLQTELETVQRALAENEDHLAEKTEIISELEARIVEMKNAETNSESQKMELENQLREIREAVRETEAKLLSQETHMSELKLEIEESKQNLKINTEKDESAERVTELETELDEARTAVTVVEEKLSKEISDLLAQLEQTEKSLKDAESKLGEQSEVIDPEANTEVDELRKQLEDVQAALQESEARLTLQDSQLDSAQETVEEERLNMTAQLEELATELESVKAAQHFIEQEKEQFQKQLQDKESQINSLQESLKTLEEEHASLAAQNIIEKEKKELQKQLQDKESELSSLQESSKTLEEEHASLTAQNAEAESEVEKLQDAVRGLEEEQESLLSRLSEKEQELQQMQEERDLKQLTLEQFSVQVDTFQEEIKSLTTFQNELQKDFDTVQSMLEEKEREIEHLTKELSESRLPPEGATSEIQDKYETEILGLKKTLQEKENIIDEKEEELYVLNEKLELQESINSELSTVRQQVADTEVSLDEERKSNKRLQDELQELRTKQSTNQQENGIDALNSNLVSEDQLQEQLSQKEEKLECVQAEVEELKEQLSGQQKELNEVQEKLRDKQRQLEELEATETDALVDTLKLRVTELEAQLQVSREVEAKNAEDPKKQLEEDGAVVQDDVVVSFVEETESPLPGDPNETRNIMEGLNERIAQLEQELCEKGDLVSRLRMESSGETPGQVDLGQQLREKTQLYDQLLTDKINLEKTLIDLENKLEEKQESLEKLEQDASSLAEKDEVISKLEEQLKERKGEKPSDEPMDVQEDKERLVQEFEIKCHELNIKLATAADEKLNLETELGEKDSKIAELESKYEDLKEQTREEASRLEEEIQKIQEVQADVQLLQQTQKREQELERELEKAQDNLEILEKTRQKLAATEASLEQTLVKLTERDEQIKALFDKGQVPLDTSTNDEVNRSLEDSQQEVYELSLELREKEEDIERLQVSLTATEEELEKKSSQLRQAEQHLETKSRELRENEERLRRTSLDLAATREEHFGSSLPLDLGDLGDQNQQQITRSESEPVLNNWRRESSFFRSRLHDVESLAREQKQELTQKNLELALVRQQLEQWLNRDLRGEGDAGTLVATLRQDLQEKDKLIQLLQIEIDEINETLALREEEIQDLRASESLRYSGPREATPPASEQQIRHLKNELRKAKTVLAAIQHSGDYLGRTPEGSAVEDELSPVRLNDDARSLRRELGQMREELQLYRTTASMSARDFVKKVMELREELSEEHKNHIRDIQERLKMDAESQLTTLQLRHEDEMKQLRQIHERKMDAALAEQRQELEKLHKSEVNRMIAEHKHQLDLVRDEGFVRDDASVTDLQQNLLADIHDTERMDNRLLDHLTRAEGVGGEDSDTATVSETPSLDTALTPGLSTKLQTLLSRLHKKGVHVLTLSELQFLQRHMTPDEVGSEINVDALRQAWEREQEALLATINSLKDLLARVHKTNNADELPDEEDWRGDLLTALCNVFTKERESLLAELRSYVVSRPDQDSVARRLEQRIADQASLHRSALDRVQHAERQSLLAEISLLRKKLSVVRQRNDEQQQTYNDKLSTLEDQSAKKERHQQRQIQVLEYKLQQEKVIQDDLKTSLDLERQRVREISSELSREKNIGLELQGELSTSQIQLSKARDALERERSRYTSVNDALEEERTKISRLTELLESERRKCALLDSQVADLRSHNKDYLEKESRFVEQLRKELEREREKRIECTRHIEQERQNKNSLQEQLEEERRRSRSVQSECDSMVAQLKLSLEAERGKIDDMDRNLEEERKSTAHVRSTLEQERAQHHELVNQDRAVIEDVEARLRSEQNKVEDLHRALAREKQGLSSLSDLLESERDTVRQTMEHERAVARQLKRDSEDLQVEKAELKRQIEFERENVKTYQDQTEKLHEEVKVLKQRENEYIARVDNQQGAARKTIRELERERDQLKINMHELELESERLREKLQDTHVELDEVRGKEMKTRHELDRVRLEASSTQRSPPTVDRVSAVRSGTDVRDAYPQLRGDMLDNVLQKLEFVAVRMQDKPVTVANGEDVVDAQVDLQTDYTANIRNLITEIKEIKESVNEVTGSASAGQIANEKIVQHNADLTAFINRVSREKEELRTSVQALEDQLAVYRSRARSEQVRTVEVTDREQEDRYLQDRMAWASERLSLQMALDAAEREVTHLQSELRHVRIQLESEEYQDVDREKMQRLYGKFLRAESFRKALVYQKRYLLLLLGGYQDCEQETLMLIAQMGGYPSDIDLRRRSRHSRFFSLFRSAARVIIAIARMRYMVRKWRRAVRVGSPVVGGRVNLNLGYMPSSTTYSPPRPTTSPRHFPSMSRIPDVPRASVSDSILVSNGDLMHTYPPPSSGVTRRQFTTPPTKDTSATSQRSCDRSLSSSARRRILQDGNNVMSTNARNYSGSAREDESTDDFLHRLESLQTRLGSYNTGAATRSVSWR